LVINLPAPLYNRAGEPVADGALPPDQQKVSCHNLVLINVMIVEVYKDKKDYLPGVVDTQLKLTHDPA